MLQLSMRCTSLHPILQAAARRPPARQQRMDENSLPPFYTALIYIGRGACEPAIWLRSIAAYAARRFSSCRFVWRRRSSLSSLQHNRVGTSVYEPREA